MFISSKFRIGRGNMFLYTKKLTAGLLVFLFFATPFYQVLADEQTPPPDNQAPVAEENVPAEETPPPADGEENPEVTPPENPENPSADGKDVTSDPNPKQQTGYDPKVKLAQPDEATGALAYDYPIVIPPGRNNFQPDFNLIYNSQNQNKDSLLGLGWSLIIPSIQRINKDGIQNLYSENNFESNLDGELSSSGVDTYAAKVENGGFLQYSFDNNIWTVTDKQGTIYIYGQTAADRQDDPNNQGHVFKWMLTEVRDTNSNFVKYEYVKDGNQIYPSKIFYTGHGTVDGIAEIDFLKVARQDITKSYKTGFSVTTNYRINQILVKFNNDWVKKYDISYGTGDNGTTSLISAIQESGKDENNNVLTLPVTSFEYQPQGKIWVKDASWQFPIDYIDPWTNENHYPIFADAGGHDRGIELEDINGDSLPDLVQANYTLGQRKATIYTNKGDGSGWVENTNWQWPTEVVNGQTVPVVFVDEGVHDQGLRLVDINGDGYPDLLRSRGSRQGGVYTYNYDIWINNKINGWDVSATWEFPIDFIDNGDVFRIRFTDTSGFDLGVRIADVNSDGLPDLIRSRNHGNIEDQENDVYLNKGDDSGWEHSTTWQFPISHSDFKVAFVVGSEDQGVRLADVNGDGLPDLLESMFFGTNCDITQRNSVYLNKGDGTGWIQDTSWQFPIDYNDPQCQINYNLAFSSGGKDNAVRLADVNGDNLIDLVRSTYYGTNCNINQKNDVYINKGDGTGWIKDTSWQFPADYNDPQCGIDYKIIFSNSHGEDRAVRTPDINGDGIMDLIRSTEQGGTPHVTKQDFYSKSGARSSLLSKIIYPEGGFTDIQYKATPLYRSGSTLSNANLPLNVETVSQITNNDGFGNTSALNYSYEGGYLYYNNAHDNKFAGFAKVTKTDSSSKTISYYHQGNGTNSTQGEYNDHVSKIGRKYRTEVTDLNGNLYSVSINKWDRYDFNNNGRNFVKLVQTLDSVYDGNSTHRDRAQTYAYDDTTGNQEEIKQWGEVNGTDSGTFIDITTDSLYTTTIDYATNTSNGVVGLPSNESTLDQNDVKVNQTRHYYDNLPLGQVGNGNETKTEQWRTGSKYIDVEKTYNSYGLVISEKDPRDKETSYIYDAYNLYPTTVTNPLNQVTHLAYDYSSGQVTQTLDPNNRAFYTDYDALDRPIAERQPDPANPSLSLAKSSYEYTTTANAVSIKKTDYLDAANSIDTYTYFDGLGRKIQERKEAEAATQFSIRDFVYGLDDLLLKESLPYFGNNSARTPATTTTALYTRYTYDPMKRVVTAKVTNDDWTTTNTYEDWKTTVTDADGKIKDLYRDAYDNLVQVGEHNDSSIYTTTYDWTGLKKLKKITDALGNIRNFSYDGLGRALMAEDLHAVGDTTFGIWYYAYDDASNLVSRTDPNNQVVAYNYDDLNRIISEDFAGTDNVDVNYEYDTCAEGIGRLCSVLNSSLSVANTYNALGQLVFEMKTIDDLKYGTQYNYDRQGNQILIINPDGSRVQYLYNAGGAVNRIQRKEKSDSGFIDVISNIDYNPVNLPTILEYGNGAVTANTYDAAELYRLSHKVTTANNQSVQDLSYDYDPVGNILQIVDASNTLTAKTTDYTYDDLHRLLSATITNSAAQGIDGEGDANQVQTFTYDAIGNILTKSDVGTYLYEGNQGSSYANPHAVTSANGVTYTYDNNGNVVSAGMLTAYAWDYNNRLTSVSNGLLGSFYSYDAGGQRVKSVTPSATTIDPTQSYSISNAVPEKHIFLGDTAIATVQGTGSGVQTYDIHADHLTGSNVITDANQNIDELTDYYAFGTIRMDQQNSSHNEDRKFTGHEYDTDTGLTYANARYYDATPGRWISQDPLSQSLGYDLTDPQTANSYSYVTNNPLRYIDQTGEKRTDYVAPPQTPTRAGQAAGTYKGVQLYAGSGAPNPANAQCVRGVQNLYSQLFGIDLRLGLGAASNYGDLRKATNGAIQRHGQGATTLPQENDIITWSGGAYGHIGMISEVQYDPETMRGMVYTVEQNHSLGKQDFGYGLTGRVGPDGQTQFYIDGFGEYDVISWQRPADGSTSPSPSAPQPQQQAQSKPQAQTNNQKPGLFSRIFNNLKNRFTR